MGIVAVIFFVPFVVWGVYNLHRRYRVQDEGSPLVEGLTLLGVLLFFAVELFSLRISMMHQWELYIFTVLGMFVAGAALYGHMAISLTTRMLVDLLSSGHDAAPDRPRFGPAEMLEREHDYEGALQEYLVIARVYPRHPEVHRRMGEALLNLDRAPEAAECLERGLQYLQSDDQSLPVVTRLCDIYYDRLGDPTRAQLVLTAFLKRFPQTPLREQVVEHLARFGEKEVRKLDVSLQALDAVPDDELDRDSEAVTVPAPGGTLQLEPLDKGSVAELMERVDDETEPPRKTSPDVQEAGPELEALDGVESGTPSPERAEQSDTDHGGLEPM